MLRSEARVPTPIGSRYLIQLCKHWSHKFAVEYTSDKGRVPFASDRTCTFEATPEALVMRLETADQETLERMQNVVVGHLKRFAFREDLGVVRWTPSPFDRAVVAFQTHYKLMVRCETKVLVRIAAMISPFRVFQCRVPL